MSETRANHATGADKLLQVHELILVYLRVSDNKNVNLATNI